MLTWDYSLISTFCTHSVVNQDRMRTFVVGTILLGASVLGSPRVAPRKEPLPRTHPKMTPEAAAACDPDYGWIHYFFE